jgi:2-iminobutanoate/2-iminopropanoate deaminase
VFIKTEKAPLVIGAYSQAVKKGNMIFVSGQLGIDPLTNKLAEGIEKQTRQVLENLQSILKKAESSLEKVVKTTVFIKNMDNFVKMNRIYEMYFTKNFPARSCVEVSSLAKDADIEIEAIAFCD